jgi:hypothetical protein
VHQPGDLQTAIRPPSGDGWPFLLAFSPTSKKLDARCHNRPATANQRPKQSAQGPTEEMQLATKREKPAMNAPIQNSPLDFPDSSQATPSGRAQSPHQFAGQSATSDDLRELARVLERVLRDRARRRAGGRAAIL